MNIEEIKQDIRDFIKKYPENYGTVIKTNKFKEKYKEHLDYIYERTQKLDNTYKFATRVYWVLNDLYDFPVCKYCGKPITVNVKSVNLGYPEYCTSVCSHKDPAKIIEQKKRCLQKYGTEWSVQSLLVKEKIKTVSLLKYGVENPLQSEVANNHRELTCLRKYGVPHIWLSKEVIKGVLQKANEVKMNKYGTSNMLSLDSIWDKIKETNRNKYGVEFPLLDENFLHICEQKAWSETSREKRIRTIISNFNVDNPWLISSIKEKALANIVLKWYNKLLENDYVIPMFSFEEYFSRDNEKELAWYCKECNTEFYMKPFEHCYNKSWARCLKCHPTILHGSSQKERDLDQYVNTIYTGTKIFNDRTLLLNENTGRYLELDIWLPELSKAIEFNGLYWHSLDTRREYDLLKLILCQDKNIQLLIITEDMWDNYNSATKELIKEFIYE